ncbi:MAG: hypothetical protein ACK559_02800, partial [bacterium]
MAIRAPARPLTRRRGATGPPPSAPVGRPAQRGPVVGEQRQVDVPDAQVLEGGEAAAGLALDRERGPRQAQARVAGAQQGQGAEVEGLG